MQTTRTYSLLTLAGTLPFVACAFLPVFGIESIAPFGKLNAIASSYGLAIACFLAGTLWGNYLSGRYSGPLNLFVISNVIFLAVWFAFIGASLVWAIAVQIVAFLLLLLVDYRLRENGVISAHYFRLRSVATAVAVVALLAILLQQ